MYAKEVFKITIKRKKVSKITIKGSFTGFAIFFF